jgi:hypothetical protein
MKELRLSVRDDSFSKADFWNAGNLFLTTSASMAQSTEEIQSQQPISSED